MAYKLYYFNFSGLGEPIRYMMHYAGIDFEDFRIPRSDWLKYKSEMPMGQMPVLEMNGKKYNQTKCICRYIAKKANLTGANELETLEADITVDTIDDMRLALSTYFQQEDPAVKEKMKEPAFTKMSFHLDKLEEQVKKNGGHFVGGKMTWADIFYAALCEVMPHLVGHDINNDYPNLKQLVDTVRNSPKIKAYRANRPKTDF